MVTQLLPVIFLLFTGCRFNANMSGSIGIHFGDVELNEMVLDTQK